MQIERVALASHRRRGLQHRVRRVQARLVRQEVHFETDSRIGEVCSLERSVGHPRNRRTCSHSFLGPRVQWLSFSYLSKSRLSRSSLRTVRSSVSLSMDLFRDSLRPRFGFGAIVQLISHSHWRRWALVVLLRKCFRSEYLRKSQADVHQLLR